MNFLKNTTQVYIITIFVTLFFALLACDTTSSDDDHDHHADDVDGLELLHNGEVYIRYFDGEVLELEHAHYYVGEEYKFTVRFLDHDGDHLHADEFDDSYSLNWDIEDEEILSIEQHEGDGRWEFHLIPLHEGESKVQFLLWHGSHADWETPPVTSANAIEFHIDEDDHDH